MDKEARRLYQKEYRQRPDVNERLRLHSKEYFQRPEVKARRQLYKQRPEVKEAHRAYMLDYCQRPEVKAHRQSYHKGYYQLPEVKERIQRHMKAYYHRPELKEHHRLRKRAYRQTLKGRQLNSKFHARHRAKGFNLLCPNIWSCPVDYHHVSPFHPYVIPLPRSVHRAVGGGSFHFAFNASMICFLYGLNIGGS